MSTRTLSTEFELKSLDGAGEFIGMASVFGVLDSQGDVVEKGAFSRSLKERGVTVPLLWQHQQSEPIGVGNLRETDRGLEIVGKLALDVAKAREAYSLLKLKALRGLSIGFKVVRHAWDAGRSARRLAEVKLYEVSLVTFPANELATVESVKNAGLIQELTNEWRRARTGPPDYGDVAQLCEVWKAARLSIWGMSARSR